MKKLRILIGKIIWEYFIGEYLGEIITKETGRRT